MEHTSEIPQTIDASDLEAADVLLLPRQPRQRSARTDESMRDGDSGHGNPEENPEDELTSDNDVGDSEEPIPGMADWLEQIPDRHGADGKLLEEPDAIAEDVQPSDEDDSKEEEEPSGDVPIPGYDQLRIPEILAKVEPLTDTDVRRVIDYEVAKKNRKTLISKLEKRLRTRA